MVKLQIIPKMDMKIKKKIICFSLSRHYKHKRDYQKNFTIFHDPRTIFFLKIRES